MNKWNNKINKLHNIVVRIENVKFVTHESNIINAAWEIRDIIAQNQISKVYTQASHADAFAEGKVLAPRALARQYIECSSWRILVWALNSILCEGI